ncbi:hypothetical protein BHE74_00040341 [Ensete ventricosum]|nr:hypothetical protein GW17_00043507 [Ensete ventricosum]RWW53191.1 hypothetical protein BHE74_00040341 [Ensete ventricosum]
MTNRRFKRRIEIDGSRSYLVRGECACKEPKKEIRRRRAEDLRIHLGAAASYTGRGGRQWASGARFVSYLLTTEPVNDARKPRSVAAG